ncbi:hypothetical protein PILCRDRAFT_162412 [Piloderma croceum F 1598]|uniref:Nucleoporin NSP1 n=1 Tax=Piloderma croceum (strain F 1598) TaxID=765440 RepID=A0A0C3GKC5_PILCF|nr:hypothetical protein PILCRDRAFT_162412 [Piloderma croceum F 1598]
MNSFFQPPQNNTNTTSGNAPAGGGIFGNQAGNAAGATGASTSIFGQPSNPGTNQTSSGGIPGALFGGGSTTTTTPSGTGGNIFGGAGNSGSGLFGGGNTSAPSSSNSLLTGGSSNTNIFGGGPFNTGGSTTAFGDASKSSDQGSASATKPAMPSFFSNPSGTSTVPASGSTPGLGGSLFGSSAPKPADSTPAPSTGTNPQVNPQAGSGLFGGGLFGKKPEDQATPGASAAPKSFFNLGGNSDTSKDSAPTAPSGGLFNLGGATKPSEKSSTTAPTFSLFGGAKDASAEKKDASAAPVSFGLFGAAKDTSAEKKDTPAAPALFGLTKEPSTEKKDASSTLGLGQPSTSKEGDKPKDALAPSGPLTTTTVSANISVPPPSMLRGKTIEEIVNRWSADLETHVREFNKFAGEVAVWDRALIENGNNLAALYSHVLAAEREQNDIDQSLDHIEQQQKDLSATLDAYEKSTEEILGGQGGSLRALDTGPADNERDKNYMLATELHTHLDDLSGSLTQMIDSVNALSLSSPGSGDAKSQQGEDAMAQIAQILSSHLESLQWIDGAVREVESKVTEVEKGVRDAGVNNLGGGNKSRGFGLNR